MIWEIVEAGSQFVKATWLVASWVLYMATRIAEIKGRTYEPTRALRWVWAELRPFYLPACFIHTFVSRGDLFVIGHWWSMATEATDYLGWFLFKDVIDDDRWERRREKLASRVERRGSRLVVAPVKS